MQKLLLPFTRFSLALFLIALLGTILAAQAPVNPDNPFTKDTNLEKVFSWYTVIYGAAITLLTRLQAAFFPHAGAVPKVAVRYILISAVVGGLFIALGFSNGWGIAVGFVGAALTYDKVLVPLNVLKTPAPRPKV